MRPTLLSTAPPARSGTARGGVRVLLTAALAAGLVTGTLGAAHTAPAQAATTGTSATATAAPAAFVVDRFDRTVTTGWGSASVGSAWSVSGNGQLSVASGGRQKVSSGQTAAAYLAPTSRDSDVRVDVAFDRPAGTGGAAYASVLARDVRGVGDYRGRLIVTTRGVLEVHLARGATTLKSLAVPGVTYAANTRYTVRTQVTGASPTTVRAKVWKAGTAEPTAWHVSTTDSTTGMQAAGRVGLSTYMSGSSTPVTAVYSALTAAPTTATTTVTTTTPTTTTTPPATGRSLSLHPFASNSVWNTAIGSGAKFEGSTGARTAKFLTTTPFINRSEWSVPVFQAKTTDRLVTLKSVRDGRSYSMNMPAGTTTTGGSDGHAAVIAPNGVTVYDAYKLVKRSDTLWEAQSVTVDDLRGSGVGAGVRAAAVPGMAGLIRTHELKAGHIPHALAIAVPNSILKSGYVWPATRQDSDGTRLYSGTVPMGSLFAIPSTVNIDGLKLSPEGKALARALQNYGAYVVDRAGSAALYCELACDAAATDRMNYDWKVLYRQMRAVTNSSPTTVGGGGTPRVAAPVAGS